MQMDWNLIRAFLVVAQQGSFTKAAKALSMSQPTLGRQVAALEQQLSICLFERVGKELKLTEAGLAMFEQVSQMAAAADQVQLIASGYNQQASGDVCVSVSQLDAIYKMPNIISRLQQQQPNLCVQTVVTNQISDLKRREADIAIRGQRPTQQDLIIKKIGEEHVRLYASQSYLKNNQHQEPTSSNQLKFIFFDHSQTLPKYLNSMGWQVDKTNIASISENQALQIELAKQHVGLIFLTEDVAKQHPDLQLAYADQFKVMTLDVWLVCHRELRTNRKVKIVFDAIAQAYESARETH